MIKILDNIILLGTSHVSLESKKLIKKTIEQFNPEVIGIELDYDRLKSLLKITSNKKSNQINLIQTIKQYGFLASIFAITASKYQNKIAKQLGVQAGDDMLTAYKISREKKIPSSLIDININYTLKKISNIKFSTKLKLITKLLLTPFNKIQRQEISKLKINPKKVPNEKTIVKLLKIVKQQMPQFYQILIEDRNKHMAKKLLNLKTKHNGYILAVVGAGHIEGMEKILKQELNLENKNK